VIDSDGRKVGLVQRVLGDRETGAFEGVVVAANITAPAVRVPQSAISAIGGGEIALSVRGAELAQ
jgi:sporulation protein YlmC with PRC-barrel domain